jgi:exonuclease SbcC
VHLRKVDLLNFCQHRKLTVEFHPGVTGVIGGNGQGKSNLMKAVRFVLIKASGNAGVMADDLNWEAAAAGESGSVELAFEKGGTDGKVKRFVNKGKASLKFGSIKAASAKATAEAMADVLSVPTRVIEEIVFVGQGQIEKILFDKPAERGKQFQALFGTGSAETIRGLLQKQIAGLSDSPVDEQIARLQKQLDVTIDPRLRELTDQRGPLAGAIKGFDEARHQKVLETFAVAFQLGQNIAELRSKITGHEADVDSGERVVVGLKSQIEGLKTDVDGEREAIAAARERVGALKQLKRASAMRSQLVVDQAAQTKILAAATPTPPSITQEKVTENKKKVEKAKAELAPKREFVKTFKGGEADATCPTCMQPVKNAAALADQFEAEVSTQDERIASVDATLNKAQEAIHLFTKASGEDQVRRKLASERLMDVEHQLTTLGAAEYDPDEAASLEARLSEFEVKEYQLTEVEHNLQNAQTDVATKQGVLADQRTQLAELEKQVVEAPTEAQRDEAQQALKGYSDAKAQLSGIDGQLAQLRNQRAGVLTELKQLKDESSKLANVREYKALCERARTVLHRDCLPLVVTRSFLTALNVYMAEYLRAFDIPFAAEIKDDLDVVCTFPGVGPKPAGRLSGGQKVMLGIAFRFAVYRLFAGDLGFMVLDEPTNMLDGDHIDSVLDVLQSVRRHAHNTGMQLIVITHEPQLETAFDDTIRL